MNPVDEQSKANQSIAQDPTNPMPTRVPSASPPGPRIQRGRATYVAGTVQVTGVQLTDSSRIEVTIANPRFNPQFTNPPFIGTPTVPDSSRNIAAGRFTINSVNPADSGFSPFAPDLSDVDWTVIG